MKPQTLMVLLMVGFAALNVRRANAAWDASTADAAAAQSSADRARAAYDAARANHAAARADLARADLAVEEAAARARALGLEPLSGEPWLRPPEEEEGRSGKRGIER